MWTHFRRTGIFYTFYLTTMSCIQFPLYLQMKLFDSIKPLFANKPLIVVLNKIDIINLDEISPERRAVLKVIEDDPEINMIQMSTVTDDGVMEVKTSACEKLLGFRVDQKMRTKKVDGILNRLHVALPKPRDDKFRPPTIPENVLIKKQQMGEKRKHKLEREIELEQGDDYVLDLKKNYADVAEEERYDIIPEFLDGHNIADYIDAEIFNVSTNIVVKRHLFNLFKIIP